MIICNIIFLSDIKTKPVTDLLFIKNNSDSISVFISASRVVDSFVARVEFVASPAKSWHPRTMISKLWFLCNMTISRKL